MKRIIKDLREQLNYLPKKCDKINYFFYDGNKNQEKAMARTRQYIIPVRPVVWKRPGLNGSQFFDQQKHEKISTGLYLQREHGDEPMWTGPIKIEIAFHLPLPHGMSIGKNQGKWHIKRPDLDNLMKFILDAATGILWQDDSIVCWIEKRKLYDKNAKTIFTVTEL
jgi:Holliday junction resolvase RusA-like endonuclease